LKTAATQLKKDTISGKPITDLRNYLEMFLGLGVKAFRNFFPKLYKKSGMSK
jgi:hypothetical protein